MPPAARLSRDTIVDAATALIEREGIDRLSMRRLADDLGCRPMSLYHHVPNKAALLALVLDHIAARIPWSRPAGTPRDRMIATATEMHHRLLDIPWIVPILREGQMTGRSALVLAQNFLTAAFDAGLDERRALGLWRTTWDVVASEVEREHCLAQRTREQRSWHQTADPDELAADYPVVAALVPRWAELATGFDVRESVAALVDGTLASSA
ncbi:TetR/AcrR family transcriptional regulator [Gordonia iterans]